MANTISPQNLICDRLINNIPTVVILEDMCLIRYEIQQFIKDELGWEVIIAENRGQAVNICEAQKAEFYIFDIKLGNEKDKSQEGIDTAEEIKGIDENVFVSIFSGVPHLDPYKRMAKRIGVNYFEEKGNVVREGVSRIAVEMLRFQKNFLNGILEKYFSSDTKINYEIKVKMTKIFSKIQEVDQKLEDIQKLERIYQFDSTNHPIFEKLTFEPQVLPIEEDENIREYESRKQDLKWREKYQDQYVSFADGKWLKDCVADNSKDLLNQLRNSEYKGKSIFYKKVPKNNIVRTQGSDNFIEEEEFYELPMSFYYLYSSEDEI
jgi:DNA-binding NarL/FixJ family response regulator